MTRLTVSCLVLVLASCAKDPPPPPERTEPWQNVPTTAPKGTLAARFAVESRCQAIVTLPAKEETPRGTIRVARGELRTNLLDLSTTTGSVELDVASIAMDPVKGQDALESTRMARNWLNVGDSRPEAERERQRWARFEITSVEDLSHSDVFEARAIRVPVATADGEAADPDAGAPFEELRRIRLTAVGRLTLHEIRVEKKVPLELELRWRRPAEGREPPTALHIRTRKPLVVTLAAHDIVPRDTRGEAVTADQKLLGVRVGREARVEVSLEARRLVDD